MGDLYFQKAKKWYNTLHVNPAPERFLYSLLFFLFIINSLLSYKIFKYEKKNHIIKQSFVLKTISHPLDYNIKISKLNNEKNPIHDIIKFLIGQYIINRESLNYDNLEGMSILTNKANLVKNTSSNNIYQDYLKELYSKDPNSDLSFVINGEKKFIEIKSIEFIYEEEKLLLQKIYYSLFTSKMPNKAKIIFAFDTTENDENIDKYYEVYISYSFFLNEIVSKNLDSNKAIEFQINGYRKMEIRK